VSAAAPRYTERAVRRVVAMLTAAVGFEFFHRQILAVAIEPIRHELGLSDTQVGSLLTLFALAYGVAAVVLGRLADAADRRAIFAGCIALWSLATAAGGAAVGFAAFAATRALAGVGQAASGACCTPLLVDYVAPARRGTALGLVSMGATLGTFVALGGGGLLVAHFGWRWLFALGGAAGALFALVFAWAVDEPPRGWSEGRAHEAGERPPLAEALRTLAGMPSLRHLTVGAVLATMSMMASAQWGPAFFERSHGLDTAQAGAAGGLAALFAAAGAVVGGALGDRLWARLPARALQLCALGSALAFPLAVVGFTTPHTALAIAATCASIFFAMLYAAPLGAIAQQLAPLRTRSIASGLINAILTLLGLGIGPLAAGWLSDRIGASAGLGHALAAVAALNLLAALHFLRAGAFVARDLGAGVADAGLPPGPASAP
jgi:predicted MFS family arabinose efflux permease